VAKPDDYRKLLDQFARKHSDFDIVHTWGERASLSIPLGVLLWRAVREGTIDRAHERLIVEQLASATPYDANDVAAVWRQAAAFEREPARLDYCPTGRGRAHLERLVLCLEGDTHPLCAMREELQRSSGDQSKSMSQRRIMSRR
jgi:hypothetical protein